MPLALASNSTTTRTAATLALLVLLGLYLHEVRPQLQSRSYPWSGHSEPFTLPTYLPGDCPYYRGSIRALLHGTLDLHDHIAWNVIVAHSQVSLGKHGEWYPKHPIAMSLLALPLYAALGDGGLLLFNLLQIAALNVLIFLLARRYCSDMLAMAVALIFAFGTLLRPAAYNFSPDVFSTLFVAGAVLAMLERRMALAGALFGAAVAAKWTNLVFLPVAGLWALATMGFRPALRMALAALPFGVAIAALNIHMFGSPLVTPYDRVLTAIGGREAIEPSHREMFDQPFFSTLWLQMVMPGKGLISSAPWVLLAPAGLYFIFRRARAEAVLLLAICLAQLAVFAPYRLWSASNYGHRFLMTVVALSAAPVAALLGRLLENRGELVSGAPTD